jgi:hypothetical protein
VSMNITARNASAINAVMERFSIAEEAVLQE